MTLYGPVFIGYALTPDAKKRWKEEERKLKKRLDRHKRIVLAGNEPLADDDQKTLQQIDDQLKQSNLPKSSKDCPECGRSLEIVTVAGIQLDCCRFCRGTWFDPGELQFFSGQSKEIPSDHLQHRASRYQCPVCQTKMTEYVFANPSNLLVDRCPNGHGVYLEDRELQRVFEIVR